MNPKNLSQRLHNFECQAVAWNDPFEEFRMQFAKGNQVRVEDNKEVKKVEIKMLPRTTIDCLKQLLKMRYPWLGRFKFMDAAFESIEVEVEITHHETYWNVIPVDSASNSITLAESLGLEFPVPCGDINELDWLQAEPPSKEDIQEARNACQGYEPLMMYLSQRMRS